VNKTNKHLEKKNSRFRNNLISVFVVVVLLLQHPVLVLVFEQDLCLSLARWLGGTGQFFFLSLSGSCLDSSSLSEVWLVLRFWRSALRPPSCPALDFVLAVLAYWGLVTLPRCLFSRARSEIHQPALCCQCVMLLC
jgi:hypothetical protein